MRTFWANEVTEIDQDPIHSNICNPSLRDFHFCHEVLEELVKDQPKWRETTCMYRDFFFWEVDWGQNWTEKEEKDASARDRGPNILCCYFDRSSEAYTGRISHDQELLMKKNDAWLFINSYGLSVLRRKLTTINTTSPSALLLYQEVIFMVNRW